MNLLKQEMKELVKERYYEYLEEEDGKVMYFKNKREAKVFMQELYDERGIILKPFVDDWVQIMTVQ